MQLSRRLLTVAAHVGAQGRSCGICGGQRGTAAGFLQVLQFPLPIIIPLIAPQSPSPIIRGWYNSPNRGHSVKPLGGRGCQAWKKNEDIGP
jgi:hypothetical protein